MGSDLAENSVSKNFEKKCGGPYLCFKATVKVSHRSDTRAVRTGSASDFGYNETFSDPEMVKTENVKYTVIN